LPTEHTGTPGTLVVDFEGADDVEGERTVVPVVAVVPDPAVVCGADERLLDPHAPNPRSATIATTRTILDIASVCAPALTNPRAVSL
jgi:hypothetical protein